MKRINLYCFLILSTILLIDSGCTEDSSASNTIESPINSNAGEDIQLLLPTNFSWLSGSYSDTKTTNHIIWKKVSGPSSYVLESPNSLKTKVSNLETGTYEFELTVTNANGITAKDTVTVTVSDITINPNEIIFKDMTWVCPMGCHLEIKNFSSYLPATTVFRIYIQRDNSSNWQEVIHESSQLPDDIQFSYTLYNASLFIDSYSSLEELDTPNIKIVY